MKDEVITKLEGAVDGWQRLSRCLEKKAGAPPRNPIMD